MAIHDFSQQKEQFVTIDKMPDFRSEVEKQLTPLSIYDHDKPDIGLAERWAEEIINVSGAWVSFYEYVPKPENPMQPWDSDTSPIYKKPLSMKAYFKPEETKFELTKWGIDNQVKATIVFPRAALIKLVGNRTIAPGDIIELPYNVPSPDTKLEKANRGPYHFRVINSNSSGMFLYRWLYVTAICELVTGDKTLQVVHRGLDGRLP